MLGSKYRHLIFWILVTITLPISVQHAISLAFVNDDAFITFRYAENLVKGNGLVYNNGERVEGYTNFLWTMILALFTTIYNDPVLLSIILGIIFNIATLTLFAFLSWKLRDEGNQVSFFLPLTTIALALNRDFCVYATSGLETSMFTFLVSATFAVLINTRSNMGLIYGGIVSAFTMLTRPDGIIFFAASVIYVLIIFKRPIISSIAFSLPTIILFIPYWIWRYSYYGYFFPNTFYAKSIDIPYYTQGLNYVAIYFQVYYVFIFIAALLAAGIWLFIKKGGHANRDSSMSEIFRTNIPIPRNVVLAGLFSILYILFVVRIGGDFMHARLLIPITPMFYFIGEDIPKRIFRTRGYVITAVIILTATLFRNDIYRHDLNVGYVVDEARFYTKEQHERSENEGKILKRYLKNLPVRMAFGPAYLKVAYYSEIPYALETSTGLTDTFVAHQSLNIRGRPGHEKPATMEYMLKRKIHFYIGPRLSLPGNEFPLNAILFDSLLAQIITYDEEIMSKLLDQDNIRFTHIPTYLDRYFKNMDQFSYDKLLKDYIFLDKYYFQNNNDTTRQAIFLRDLDEKKPRVR